MFNQAQLAKDKETLVDLEVRVENEIRRKGEEVNKELITLITLITLVFMSFDLWQS